MRSRNARRALAVSGVLVAAVLFGAIAAAGRDDLIALVGGEATAAETGSPAPSAPEPTDSVGLTEAQAVDVAHAAAVQTVDRELRVARSGPLSEVWEDSIALEWAQALPRDQAVWYLFFMGDDGGGSIVIVDYYDGTVYHVQNLRD